MDEKKQRLSNLRKAIYARNKKLADDFKHNQPCDSCNLIFPHYQLDFAEDTNNPNSVAKLIINRASPERLSSAMKASTIMCLNCLAQWRTIHHA